MRKLAAIIAILAYQSGGLLQPLSCTGDGQCTEGTYCNRNLHICHQCIKCSDYKRQSPTNAHYGRITSTCIKSITECGSCIDGYVEDHKGYIDAQCVPPDGRDEQNGSSYIYWVLGGGVLTFIIIAVVTLFIYLRKFKDVTCSSSFFAGLQGISNGNQARVDGLATISEAPPPYNPKDPARPTSPSMDPDDSYTPIYDEERSFIKKEPRPHDARESADKQTTRVFNNPAYVHQPSSYDSTNFNEDNDNSNTVEPFIVHHDDETMESPWTPNTNSNNNTINNNGVAGGALAARLAEARATTLVTPPAHPAHPAHTTTTGSMNNGNSDSETPRNERASNTSGQGQTTNLTVIVQNIINNQQVNANNRQHNINKLLPQ